MSGDEWGERSDRTPETEWGTTDTETEWGSTEAETETGATESAWGESSSVDSYRQTPPVGDSEQMGPEPLGRVVAALVGGGVGFAIALVLNFVPLIGFFLGLGGMMIGGVVAGYLRGSDTKESTLTGWLAGAFAAVPGLLIGALVIVFFGTAIASEGGDLAVGSGVIFIIGLFFLAGLVLNIVVSAIGAEVTDRRPP